MARSVTRPRMLRRDACCLAEGTRSGGQDSTKPLAGSIPVERADRTNIRRAGARRGFGGGDSYSPHPTMRMRNVPGPNCQITVRGWRGSQARHKALQINEKAVSDAKFPRRLFAAQLVHSSGPNRQQRSTSPSLPPTLPMYEKPLLQRFGTFRELTQLGLASSTDGASIFGIGSPGCSTTIGGHTWEIGCPTGATTS